MPEQKNFDHEYVEDLLELNSLVLPEAFVADVPFTIAPLAPEAPAEDVTDVLKQEDDAPADMLNPFASQDDPFVLPEGYEATMPSEEEMEEIFADEGFQDFFQSLMMASENDGTPLLVEPNSSFEVDEGPIEK